MSYSYIFAPYKEQLDSIPENDDERKYDVIITSSGRRGNTMAIPELITLFAYHISNKFAVNVSSWIQEWRTQDEQHENEYCAAIDAIVNDTSPDQPEAKVRDALAADIDGALTEVTCGAGRIDILGAMEIIEVKHVDQAMYAIGQILCYAMDYPDRKKRIHLFGGTDVSSQFKAVCARASVSM